MINIYKQVGNKLGLDNKLVEKVYRAYWYYVKETISSMNLNNLLSENEFLKLRTSFNIPSLGKLGIKYSKYYKLNSIKKDKYDSEYKEDKTNV